MENLIMKGHLVSQLHPPIMNAGFYTAKVYVRQEISPTGQLHFTLPARYQDVKFISRGAQGFVISALDVRTNRRVAIKKLVVGKELVVKRSYREFMMLSSIEHPNIVKMHSAFTPATTSAEFNEHYIVMELMDNTLLAVTREARTTHRTLSFLIYQLLCAVHHMKRLGLVHRDLKPENIVINNEDCTLKVLDFGLARHTPLDIKLKMTDYVVTRYYRAPEVIVGTSYDETIDIWSVGSIMAELVLKRPIFPSQDQVSLWSRIVQVLGTPSESYVGTLDAHTAQYIRSLPQTQGFPMDQIMPDALIFDDSDPHFHNESLTGDNARDLLAHMLVIDPSQRYDITKALNHPYVKHWHDDSEVNAPLHPMRYDGSYDDRTLTTDEWKELLFTEVKLYESNHDIF